MPLLILSLTFSISACGKTTSEKAAEKAQEELGLSDDEAAELKEVYDDVLEDDAADTTKQSESETKSSEKVVELKSYELTDEVKNADASELLFQVDDIVLKLDGSMTFHDVITAFGNNDEDYIWKESENVYDNPEDAESTLIGAQTLKTFTLCKVVSEESDAVEYAELSFINPTDDAIETSESLLARIRLPFINARGKVSEWYEGFPYYIWFPGGIGITDAGDLTWDNVGEVLEKAGYIKTKKLSYEEDATMTMNEAFTNDVPAFYLKDSQELKYTFCVQNQYKNSFASYPMGFTIDFSGKSNAASWGLGFPLIDNY